MIWEKIGLVKFPSETIKWAEHSLLQPTPFLLNENTVRIFCGMRDAEGRSRVGFIDISPEDPESPVGFSLSPCLDIGEQGMFDESGVVPCALRYEGDALLLYYAGYELSRNVRFKAYTGLAISYNKGMSFVRKRRVPVLERSDEEPLFRAVHSILQSPNGWDIWYGAGEKFINGETKSLPVYNIKYMHSSDGLSFPNDGTVVIDISGDEHRVGRPFVLKNSNGYTMLYGYGSEREPYALAVAHSLDGKIWTKMAEAINIIGSGDYCDDEMKAYPAVIRMKIGTYLFYNGNQYGKFGFICCKLREDPYLLLSL